MRYLVLTVLFTVFAASAFADEASLQNCLLSGRLSVNECEVADAALTLASAPSQLTAEERARTPQYAGFGFAPPEPSVTKRRKNK